jgi:hypothetical protein
MPPAARVFGLTFGSMLAIALAAHAAGPAESLFQLVPADATATLVIEDLRGQLPAILASPLADGLQQLPFYKAWAASPRFRRFDEARKRVERVIGVKVSTLRDELLGDAVVLSLRIPRDGRPEDARGLLLTRVRNRALLERLVLAINTAQTRAGELTRVDKSTRNEIDYWTREFRPNRRRPREYYTILDDDTLAWSNAEELIQGVIDRKVGKGRSLAAEPKFQQVRSRLPEQSALSLYAEPLLLRQVLTSVTRPRRPASDRSREVLERYLRAHEYFGAAATWRDGIILHTEEALDPGKLDPWIRQWAAAPGEFSPSLRSLPADAVAMASVHFDFRALLDAVRAFVPVNRQSQLANMVHLVNGLLLGHDLEKEVLAQMGPGVLAYLEAPTANDAPPVARLSKVLVTGQGDPTGLSPAVENALRTALTYYALDSRHGKGQLQLDSHEVDGRKVTALRPTSPFAFALDGDRIIVGSSNDAVGRVLNRAGAATELESLRAARFPKASSFACADLLKLHRFVTDHRESLIERLAASQERPVEEVGNDLDQAVALMALFRQAYLTFAIEPDATAVHHVIGLIAREPAAASRP